MSGSVRKQIFLSALCLCVVCLLSSCYRLPQGERPFDYGYQSREPSGLR